MAFIVLPEILHDLFRWLAGLSKQQRVGAKIVDDCPEKFNDLMRFRKVFAVGALFFPEVRDGIGTQAINTLANPIHQNAAHLEKNCWIVVVQVGLKLEKTMEIVPVAIGLPVAVDHAFKQQTCFGVAVFIRIPDVVIAKRIIR